MYAGWLTINGLEVVNTHRAVAYADTAGVAGIYPCSACSSVMAADPRGGRYRSPLLDTDNRPPWWPPEGTDLATSDALDFLGVVGVSIDGVDDSMRDIKVTEGISSGGYLGPLRYRTREITVRAALIAGSDCALGYGLNWLRSVDSADNCDSSLVGVYECCPHVHAADCFDSACASKCIRPYGRVFRQARMTSGPHVLRRFDMTSRGVVAEVEFTIIAGDPAVYTESLNPVLVVPESSVYEEPPPVTTPVLTDGFAVQPTLPPPPSSVPVPAFPPRQVWARQQLDVDGPIAGIQAKPTIVIESDEDVADLRLSILGDTGGQQYVMGPFPAGGSVTIDFVERRVVTRSNGYEQVRNGYLLQPNGAPIAWPEALDASGYTVLLDRPSDAAPLRIGAVATGLVAA